jgi:hypothetical protein
MSENNNNNDFSKQFNDFVNKAVKTAQDYGKKAADRVDLEKQKAGIRSEIGHTKKELADAYNSLGRMYYDAKVNNTEMPTEQLTLDQITEKENTIKELNDKLDALGK